MTLRRISYDVDGVTLEGFFAGASRRLAPGILVAHESPGLTEHIKERTRRLAEIGYAAFALDLFGAHDLDIERARRLSSEVMTTPGLMYARANAALKVLASQAGVDPQRLAAIGFCLGGVVALELARHNAPVRCAVGFHPGFKRPAGSPDGRIAAKILMMTGDLDPVVSEDDRQSFCRSMTASQADWQLHVFGGVGHSYTNRAIDAYNLPGFAYSECADRRSWALMVALLSESLAADDSR